MCDRSPRWTTPRTSLLAAGVATIRNLPTAVGLDVWPPPRVSSRQRELAEAIFRDMVNAIADDAARLLDQFIGRPATHRFSPTLPAPSRASSKRPTSRTSSVATVSATKVAVSNGADPSDNRISAVVSLKFAEEIGFVDLTINAASADQSI